MKKKKNSIIVPTNKPTSNNIEPTTNPKSKIHGSASKKRTNKVIVSGMKFHTIYNGKPSKNIGKKMMLRSQANGQVNQVKGQKFQIIDTSWVWPNIVVNWSESADSNNSSYS